MRSDYRTPDTASRSRPRSGTRTETPVSAPGVRNDTPEPKRRRSSVKPSAARVAIDRAAMLAANKGMAANEVTREVSERAPAREPRNTKPIHPARSDAGSMHRQAGPPVGENSEVKENRPRFDWSRLTSNGWIKYSLMAVAIALLIAVSFMKPIDKSSESQIDSAMTRALIGFGIARTLNGVISVAQGTEFAVQPAGVGVNFSPGEILDPVNDLVERFSWVMLVATSSLGIQKILLEVSSWIGISFMLAGAAFFWLLTKWQSGKASAMATFASRLLLLMLLLRFLIPVGAIANDWVYRQFLEPRFETSSQELEVASERIREISTRTSNPAPEADSIRQKAKNLYNSMTSKFDFDGMLMDYRNSAENVSEHAVNLIVVFLLQTILFPLLFLYLVYRAFRYLLLPPPRSRS